MLVEIFDAQLVRSPRSVAWGFDDSGVPANPFGVKLVDLRRRLDIEMEPSARLSLRALNENDLNRADAYQCRVRGPLLVRVKESACAVRPPPTNAERERIAVVRDARIYIVDPKDWTAIEECCA